MQYIAHIKPKKAHTFATLYLALSYLARSCEMCWICLYYGVWRGTAVHPLKPTAVS